MRRRLLLALALFTSSPAFAGPCTPDRSSPPPVVIREHLARGIRISGQSAFDKALRSAKGGETLNLADGSYSLSVANVRPASVVTIQGSRDVKFGAYGKITGSTNLRFGGVSFNGQPGMIDGQWIIQIASSSNITFDNVLISGPDASGYGIYVKAKDVKNITIRNSEITKVKFGVLAWGGVNWLIEKNRFHDLSSDGIQISNTAGAVIQDNSLVDFKPIKGYHPDAVQLTNVNYAMKILRNCVRGAAQGIFYDGRLGTQQDLTANDNDISVEYPRALSLSDAIGSASGNKIAKGGRYPPIIALGAMKSDGTNRVDGRKF